MQCAARRCAYVCAEVLLLGFMKQRSSSATVQPGAPHSASPD